MTYPINKIILGVAFLLVIAMGVMYAILQRQIYALRIALPGAAQRVDGDIAEERREEPQRELQGSVISLDTDRKRLEVALVQGNDTYSAVYDDTTLFFFREILSPEKYQQAQAEFGRLVEGLAPGDPFPPPPPAQDGFRQVVSIEDLSLRTGDLVSVPFEATDSGNQVVALNIIKIVEIK